MTAPYTHARRARTWRAIGRPALVAVCFALVAAIMVGIGHVMVGAIEVAAARMLEGMR